MIWMAKQSRASHRVTRDEMIVDRAIKSSIVNWLTYRVTTTVVWCQLWRWQWIVTSCLDRCLRVCHHPLVHHLPTTTPANHPQWLLLPAWCWSWWWWWWWADKAVAGERKTVAVAAWWLKWLVDVYVEEWSANSEDRKGSLIQYTTMTHSQHHNHSSQCSWWSMRGWIDGGWICKERRNWLIAVLPYIHYI